ncbi:amidase [Actinomadura sp. ATCC 31491]|uniref:Amidase n=1 Tax=Actinomadura luzonensis TaxID=2805427 RepID=A0ABT0G3E4_9ACTN|nr:amidase [Actinomadura luzonensis]MCK2219067.1 amidase [Actinomadura luzonensis]
MIPSPGPVTGPFSGRTLAGLGRDLREGRTSAAELTALALDAIAAHDPGLNAFVTVDAAGAAEAARRADAELAAGEDRGPLHGMPVAVKDLIMIAGLPVTMGSRHFAGHVPGTDAACVALLRRAGAVVVGTTTTHEFAYGPTGDRSAGGPARNPWDPSRMTGGSSAGSGAAVAAGLVPLALGTDTGGSVRIPAALCGVSGFKPAYGAIPADGVFPLSRTLDHVGVLAATPEDCLLAYGCLAVAPPPAASAPAVAWLEPESLFPGDPRVTAAARAAAGDVRAEVRMPAEVAELFRETYLAIQSCETAAVHAGRLAAAPGLFDPEVLDRLRLAAELPGWRYVRALEARRALEEHAEALFGGHDVLAMPAVPILAPPIGAREVTAGGARVQVRAALLAMTSPWNVLGRPALTVPAGTVDGLPVGLQLVARPGGEAALFAAARQVRGGRCGPAVRGGGPA